MARDALMVELTASINPMAEPRGLLLF